MCLVYLEWKLQQDRCGLCIFKPEIGRKNKFRDKQATDKGPLMFLVVEKLKAKYEWCFARLKWKGAADISKN